MDAKRLCITPDRSIREVMTEIDRGAKGIVLLVDSEQRLIETITDGDIRRAILSGIDLDLPVSRLLTTREARATRGPITAPTGTGDAQLLRMMNEHGVRHVPLVDVAGRITGLAVLSDLVREYELPLGAVVMAGGFGTRLRPLTDTIPKPMLPVGGRPLLELIIDQLRTAGVRRISLTTHYMREVIEEHFGNGRDFGVEIQYVNEDEPLGTAGALSLLDAPQEPLLVINGDILTRTDYRAMHEFHQDHQADMTIAVRQYEYCIPYGVIKSDGPLILDIVEKPTMNCFVSAGIYLLGPSVVQSVPRGQRFDMPDLIRRLVSEGRRVVSFPVREYWLDIGQMGEYEKALADVKTRNF